MPHNLFTSFNSAANPEHELGIVYAVDGDLHFYTQSSRTHYNAAVRLRTYDGGGHNTLLRKILLGMVNVDVPQDHTQMDFFNTLYPVNAPNEYRQFRIACDDNPGSHLVIAVAKNAFGLQTNYHDQERNRRSGGYSSMQGDGPLVWMHKDSMPKVYSQLRSVLVQKRNPDRRLFGDNPFKFVHLGVA